MKKELLRLFIMVLKETFRVFVVTVISLTTLLAYDGNAQYENIKDIRITVKIQDATLEEAIKAIEGKTPFKFTFEEKDLLLRNGISIKAKNKSLDQVLQELSRVAGVEFKQINDNIHIKTAKRDEIKVSSSQEKTITGKVTSSEDGIGLPGVNVVVKGTTQGTVTDVDGNYTLDVPGEESVLVFSSVGFIQEEVTVGNQTVIDMALTPDVTALEEIVVVGYSTVKKRDLTGSISSIDKKELSKYGAPNLAQAIQGRAAGIYITRDNGKPGAGFSVRIRGVGGVNDSEPLYVIDGVYGGSLTGINPNEIQSIEILKDASSAAIYGARGANGVVIITTNRGSAGKMNVTYAGSYGIQNMINSGNVQLLNAVQYGEVQNTMYRNDGLPEPFGGDPNRPAELFPDPSQLSGANWLDVVVKSNVPIQDNLLSFSGGSEKHFAYVSLGYLNQDGLLVNSGYDRFTFRINTDHKITDWLKMGNRTSYSRSNEIGENVDNKYSNFYRMLTDPPTIPVYNEDGTFAGPPDPFYSPSRTAYARIVSRNVVTKSSYFSNNIYLELKPIKSLTFTTTLSNTLGAIDYNDYRNNIYDEGIVSDNRIEITSRNSLNTRWIWNNVLAFDKSFGNHHLKALVGYESQAGTYNSIRGSSTYSDPSFRVVESGAADISSFQQNKGEDSMISYFGNITYNYKDKYYFTGNIRRDGSSRFGANNKFGTFPSASVAWRVSNESFMQGSSIFSDLKIRASYGQVGNDKIGNYRYLAPMATVFYSMSGLDGDFLSGLVTKGIGNPDLKWETSTQKNIGIDMSFFDDKLSFIADYFVTDVEDMLLGKTIPVTSGIAALSWGRYVTVITNAGSLTNSGFELEASYRNSIGDLTYDLSGNITTYNNEVTDLGENEYLTGAMYQDVRNRTYVGGSLGDFYGYVTEGIFQTQEELDAANGLGDPNVPYQQAETVPGDFRFKDLNGDGVINDQDREIIGSPIPDFTYGFGLNLGYKGFKFSVLFYGSQGNQIYNSLRQELEQTGRAANKSVTVLNAWNGPGTSNTITRRAVQDRNNNFRTSSTYVEDASFLRLQNIMFSYNPPVSFGSLNIFLSGDNLLTFTKYQGFNPEVTITKDGVGGNRLDSGVDYGFYPSASIIRLGVRISYK